MSEINTSALANYDNNTSGSEEAQGSGFGSKLTGALGSVLTAGSPVLKGEYSKLNELASKIKTFDVDGLLKGALGAIGDYGKSLLNSGISLLTAMKNDALKNLENATVSFISNIAEDFYNNIKASMFISDTVYCATIKGLYYGGADLAYGNHYIRNSALTRDWVESLEFLDGEYGISYNMLYSNLTRDINLCVANSCWKNLHYIYKNLYKEYNKYTSEISVMKNQLNAFDPKDTNTEVYKNFSRTYQLHVDSHKKLARLMVRGLKNLIIYSHTYLKASDLKKFFIDFPLVLKPKYYGISDDVYKQSYMFSDSECKDMMPLFTGHKLSNTDNYMIELMSQTDNSSSSTGMTNKIDGTNIIDKYRNNVVDRQEKNAKALSVAAMKSGTKGIIDNIRETRPNVQNSDRTVVKYRDTNITTIMDNALDVYERDDYIAPRNDNIRQIYVLLSSEMIFGEDRMINEYFYKRCKMNVMTSMNANLDRVKGILGNSMMFQSVTDLYNLADAIDSTAYKYTKDVEDNLFDPKINKTFEDATGSTFAPDFLYNNLDGQLEFKPLSDDVVTQSETNLITKTTGISAEGTSSTPPSGYITTTNNANPYTSGVINNIIENDIAVSKEITNILRFIDDMTMIMKRDVLIEYLTFFYTIMIGREIPEDNCGITFAHLIYSVFGITGYTNPDKLNTLFANSTNTSLNNNFRILIGISLTQQAETFLSLKKNNYKDLIINLYDIMVSLLSVEVENNGFSKALLKYDKEFLQTLVKQNFYSEIDYLKSINSKSNPAYSSFYRIKDKLTKNYKGYNLNGIMGYDEKMGKTQYSNIITGDWISTCVTPEGIFFGGSDNTENNGIKLIDPVNNKILNTNISSGNWTSILCLNEDQIFFIKDNDEVYYWNGSKIITTGETGYKNWELIQIANTNNIILASKVNSGFKRWNNGKFTNVTTIGGNYKYEKTSFLTYLLYATGSKSIVYSVNMSSISPICPGNEHIVNSHSSYTVDSHITTTTTDEEGNETSVTSNYTDQYILLGTSNGLHICSYRDSSITVINNQFNAQNTSYLVTGTKDYKVSLLSSNGGVYVSYKPNSPTSNTITRFNIISNNQESVSIDKIITSTSNIKPSSITSIIKTHSFSDSLISDVITTDSGVVSNQVCLIDNSGVKFISLVLVNNNDIHSMDYYEFNKNKFFIAKNDIYYYNSINNDLRSIFSDNSDKVNGWEFIECNSKLFFNNPKHKLGLRYFNGTNVITTNLNYGSWNICNGNSKYLITSKDGSNTGIRISNISNNPSFIDVLPKPILIGDFSNPVFNSGNKKFYYGSDRTKIIFSIDSVIYDLDEFIYPLQSYELQQILINYNKEKSTTFLEDLIEKMSMLIDPTDPDPTDPDPTDPTDPDPTDPTDPTDPDPTDPDPIDPDPTDPDPDPTDPNSGTVNFSDDGYFAFSMDSLNDITNHMVDTSKTNIRNALMNSNIFTDMFTYAEAKNLFNITNENDLDQLELSFILDLNKNSQDRAYRYYKSRKQKIYIKQAFEHDGNEYTDEVDSTAWNVKFNNSSEDYLNSDADGLSF